VPLTNPEPGVASWQITSDPSNAAVWIDGADTGARTPATFAAPPAGTYVVRLVLAGYADDTSEIQQREGVGLSLGRILRPREVVAKEEASRVAAQRPVDGPARQATRGFLGNDHARAQVLLESTRSISLPQLALLVRGDGTGKVTWTRLSDGTEQTVPIKVTADEVKGLFDEVIAQGFAEVVCVERLGMPDEVRVRITVTNTAGESKSAVKWSSDKHPRFDPVEARMAGAARKLPPEVRREIGY
jgi:hypothetical protein